MLAMIYEFCSISLAGVTSAFTYVFVAVLGSIALIILIVYRWSNDQYIFIINCLSVFYIFINSLYLISKRKTFLPILPSLQCFLYITLPLLAVLFWLKEIEYAQIHLFSIFAMIWISDIAAYFVGKSFGKHKLFESVSPKKTWEGFFGAGVFTLIASIIISFLVPSMTLVQWGVIACIVWIAGSLGDLVESSFKRHYKIKDSGTILPGHGGFLDRLDSFIFAMPVALLYLKLFVYAS